LDTGAEGEGRRLDDKFVVFSKGSRGCVGREIAMLVLARAVAGLLGRWELTATAPFKRKNFLEMQYEECWIKFSEPRG